MTLHLQGRAARAAEHPGSYTACGVFSPTERLRGPYHMVYPLRMTTYESIVDCARCQKIIDAKFRSALSPADRGTEVSCGRRNGSCQCTSAAECFYERTEKTK